MLLLGHILVLSAQEPQGRAVAAVPALAAPQHVWLDTSGSASKLESGDAEPRVSEHPQRGDWEGEGSGCAGRAIGVGRCLVWAAEGGNGGLGSPLTCCLVSREGHVIARTDAISGAMLFVRQKVSVRHQGLNAAGRRLLLHARSCQELSCSIQTRDQIPTQGKRALNITPHLSQGRLLYCVFYAQDLIWSISMYLLCCGQR